MRRALKALIADYLKLAGVAGTIASLQYVIWPWLFYTYVLQAYSDGHVSPVADPNAVFTYYFSYFGMLLIGASTIGIMTTTRLAKRNRLLPLSTKYLAAWHWFSIIATVGMFNLVVQLAYWRIFELAWPIVTTTVAMCTMTAALVAAGQWLRDCRIHRLAVAVLFCTGTGYWCVQRLYGAEFSQPMSGWYQLEGPDLLILAIIWSVSWSMMYFGYAGYRSGEPVKGAVLTFLTQESLRPDSSRDLPLAELKSAKEAFLWMDWYRVRLVSIGLYGGMQFGVGGLFWLLLRGNTKTLDGIPVLYLMFSGVMGWMLGTIYAAATDTHSTGPMTSLAGSLPVSDLQLGQFVTRSIGRFALVTWASMTFACLVVALISLPTILTPEFRERLVATNLFRHAGPVSALLLVAASAVLSWAGCGLGASIALTAQKRIAQAFAAIVIVWCVCGIGIAFEVPYARPIGFGLLIAAAVAGCGLGSFGLMLYARRNHLLTPPLFRACVAASVLVCVLTFATAPLDMYWKTVAAGFSVLTVLPISSIPTAMSWNRHR